MRVARQRPSSNGSSGSTAEGLFMLTVTGACVVTALGVWLGPRPEARDEESDETNEPHE